MLLEGGSGVIILSACFISLLPAHWMMFLLSLHLDCSAGTSSAYAHVVSDPCANTLSPPPPMTAPPPVIGPKVFFTSRLPDQTVDSFDDIQQSIFIGLAGQYAQGELVFCV